MEASINLILFQTIMSNYTVDCSVCCVVINDSRLLFPFSNYYKNDDLTTEIQFHSLPLHAVNTRGKSFSGGVSFGIFPALFLMGFRFPSTIHMQHYLANNHHFTRASQTESYPNLSGTHLIFCV